MAPSPEADKSPRSPAPQNANGIHAAHLREEALRAQLAAVVESSDDAIVSKTLQGVINSWNAGAQRIFGYTAEEVVGKPVTILIPPDRIPEEAEILANVKSGRRVDHYETVRIRKDGTPLDVSLTVSPVKDAAGTIIGASKIARDITSRKRMEEALRDETRVLELLNKTGSTIASQLDLQMLVQTITDAATELSGAQFGAFFYSARGSEEGGDTLRAVSGASREAFSSFPMPQATQVFHATLVGEGVVRSDDITRDKRYGKMAPHLGMPEGHPPVASYLAVPVVSRSREVIGGLFLGHSARGVFTERTQRIITGVAAQAAVAIDNARLYEDVKQAAVERERLLDAERAARAEAERVSLMKDEFLATLSHELRTPLHAILGWSHLLRPRAGQDPELTEGLGVIERNARVQTQLIEDLLDMSRIISGKIRLDVQQVDLRDVVHAAIDSVRHAAEAREIRLHAVLDPLAGPVRGDPGRLQQCFWNILSNAIKFTPKGGKVQVSLERVNSHVEVRVTDNGHGIEPQLLPHLFDRFHQGDSSTTRHFGGLGLGLSIVKHLVELHGGGVRAQSDGKGQGATFCIELPLTAVYPPDADTPREHPRGLALSAAAADHPPLHGITVLAVDDEPDARRLLKYVLESCGAHVITTTSAQEALEIVRRQRPDVIVSDIGMPDEDGYAFIKRVRALAVEDGGRTPAAALTAFARTEDRTRALRAGYQTHIAKPVEASELTAVVASLAQRQ